MFERGMELDPRIEDGMTAKEADWSLGKTRGDCRSRGMALLGCGVVCDWPSDGC